MWLCIDYWDNSIFSGFCKPEPSNSWCTSFGICLKQSKKKNCKYKSHAPLVFLCTGSSDKQLQWAFPSKNQFSIEKKVQHQVYEFARPWPVSPEINTWIPAEDQRKVHASPLTILPSTGPLLFLDSQPKLIFIPVIIISDLFMRINSAKKIVIITCHDCHNTPKIDLTKCWP